MKMYCLILKDVPDGPPTPEGQPMLRYRELLQILLKHPKPGQGIRKKELKLRMMISRQIAGAGETVLLGEQEKAFLNDLAANFLWASATEPLEMFLEDLEKCPEYRVEEKEASAKEAPVPRLKEQEVS